MKTNKVNCINIAYIFKTSLGSINGSWTEGNVSTVKKITTPSGHQYPYISGQSIKYQIRKAWKDMNIDNFLSETKQAEKKEGVNFTSGDPEKFIDDDLLGYMIASKNENRRRTAVVRTSAAIGLFPFRNDRDLGTKSKEEIGGDVSAGGNIFETEIYYNYFRVNFLIEIDRLGEFQDFELSKENKGKINTISIDKKRERLNHLLKAITHIWGGGKQSRFLTDISPKFIVITAQTAKSPIFLETLTLNEKEEINTKAVNEVLEGNNNIIETKFIGLQSGIFKNNVASEINNVTTIQEAFDNLKSYINDLNF